MSAVLVYLVVAGVVFGYHKEMQQHRGTWSMWTSENSFFAGLFWPCWLLGCLGQLLYRVSHGRSR